MISITIIILFTAGFSYHNYQRKNYHFFRIQKYADRQEWNKLLQHSKKHPSRNLLVQFYTNLALSETNNLNNQLFSFPQSFGIQSLVLPEKMENDLLMRGMQLYYSLGFTNDAQRWAYETFVSLGPQASTLKMLARTSIINGDFRVARKYLHLLKESLFYAEWAREYEKKMDNKELLQADEEIMRKRTKIPYADFFSVSEEPDFNLELLIRNSDKNLKALNYKIAMLLLKKDAGNVVEQIKTLADYGCKELPVHVAEAAIVYKNITGKLPDLGGMQIEPRIEKRFKEYVKYFKQYGGANASSKQALARRFGNTFWYHLHFGK